MVTRSDGFYALTSICGDLGALHCVVPTRARQPAHRAASSRQGFRFLLLRLHSHWTGCDRCGRVIRTPPHRAISIVGSNAFCVAAMQVYGVGDGDVSWMADFRCASESEMEGWAAEEQLYPTG